MPGGRMRELRRERHQIDGISEKAWRTVGTWALAWRALSRAGALPRTRRRRWEAVPASRGRW
jgi:hypothetical protein